MEDDMKGSLRVVIAAIVVWVGVPKDAQAQTTDTAERALGLSEIVACLRLGPACEFYAVARIALGASPTGGSDRTDTLIRMPDTRRIVPNPSAMQHLSKAEQTRLVDTARRVDEQTRRAEEMRASVDVSQLMRHYDDRIDQYRRRRRDLRRNAIDRISSCQQASVAGTTPAAACRTLERNMLEVDDRLRDAIQELVDEKDRKGAELDRSRDD
jgi:hypothetical protein